MDSNKTNFTRRDFLTTTATGSDSASDSALAAPTTATTDTPDPRGILRA